MTQEHPITPPPKLVDQWCDPRTTGSMRFDRYDLAARAAQWGADQELEVCCELTRDNDGYDAALALRAERRSTAVELRQSDDDLDEFATFWWGAETDNLTVAEAVESGQMTAFVRAVSTWLTE